MSFGFGSEMMGTYVSMADTYTGAGSGAGAGFGAGDLSRTFVAGPFLL